MKKCIGLLLIFILVFTVMAGALAGSKPKITKQPESATVKKGGKVTFSITTTGTVDTVIWYFIDPETGNEYTGKKLSGAVKGVKIDGPTNGKKITLKNVPESMHGWTVYAHVNGNGYKVDSDQVQLLISGMETAEPAATEAPAAESGNAGQVPGEQPASSETLPAPAADQPAGPFTVAATSKALRRLDASGNIIDDKLYSRLEFEETAYILVSSKDQIGRAHV